MLEKGKISTRQTWELLFITVIATEVLLVPAITSKLARHDAWLASIAAAPAAFIILALVSWLGKKHPQKNLYQYAEAILGKWPGKIVGLLYVWMFLQLASIVVRQFGDFLTTAFMPNTPLSVFNFSIIFLAAWAVIAGLEAIARMNEFIIILVVFFLLLVFFLSIPNWELTNLQPFLAQGILPVIRAGSISTIFLGEIIVLAVILPYLTRPHKAFFTGTIAIVGSVFVVTASIFGTLAIFGPELTSSFRFPLHLFVRTINIGDILTRFEVIVMVTWVAGVFVKTSVFFYCAALGLAEVLGLKEYRPVVFPLGIIMSVFTILFFKNVVELGEFLANTAPLNFIPLFYLGLPLMLALVTFIREKFFGTDFSQTQKQPNTK